MRDQRLHWIWSRCARLLISTSEIALYIVNNMILEEKNVLHHKREISLSSLLSPLSFLNITRARTGLCTSVGEREWERILHAPLYRYLHNFVCWGSLYYSQQWVHTSANNDLVSIPSEYKSNISATVCPITSTGNGNDGSVSIAWICSFMSYSFRTISHTIKHMLIHRSILQ